jgi:DNA-binding transcriptional LysR family regulator
VHVGAVEDPSVVAVKVAEVPRIVVAAPSVLSPNAAPPTDPAALAGLPWLALRTFYRNEVRLHHADGRQHSFAVQPRLSTDSLFALRSGALLGLGACLASAWVVADDVAQGRLLHLAPQWYGEPLPVYLVYPYAQFYPAKLRRFIDAMRGAIPLGATWSTGWVPAGGG